MWLIIIAVFLWSSAFVAGKYSYSMLDPALMVQLRLCIAALLVAPWFLSHWRKIPPALRKQVWWLALLNYPLVFLLQFIGLKYTSASSAATMLGLEPLLVVFVGHFFLGDKAKAYHWIFGFIAFVGVSLLIYGGGEGGEISPFGCFLVVMAGVVFSAALRWTQNVIAQIGASSYTVVSIVLATIACLPFTLLLTQSWQIHWNWQGFAGLMYLGVGCSWLAFYLWNKGIDGSNSNTAGLLVSLEPVFGIFLALFLLQEHISLLSWAGILTVLSTTLLASFCPTLTQKWEQRRQQKTKNEA